MLAEGLLIFFGFVLSATIVVFVGYSFYKSVVFLQLSRMRQYTEQQRRLFVAVAVCLFEPCVTIPAFSLFAFDIFDALRPLGVLAYVAQHINLLTPWVVATLSVWPWITAVRTGGRIRKILIKLGFLGLCRGALFINISLGSLLFSNRADFTSVSPILIGTGIFIGFIGLIVSYVWVPAFVQADFALVLQRPAGAAPSDLRGLKVPWVRNRSEDLEQATGTVGDLGLGDEDDEYRAMGRRG